MTKRVLSRWTGKLGLALMLVGTTVLAQPADDPEAAPTEVKFRKGSQLTAEEQLTQAEVYLTKMKSVQTEVGKLAEKARADKDIIKLNCVNDKLIQIKGNMNLAEKTRDALKVAAARNDEGERNHEFAKLTITYQKVTVLGQEAEACIGEDIAFVGATKVDVEVDKDIPEEDPTEEPPPPLPIVRPPLASPFS
jgi:hypothetical protein